MPLDEPEVQRKVLQDESLVIIEEASKGQVEGLRKHVESRIINVNEASVK